MTENYRDRFNAIGGRLRPSNGLFIVRAAKEEKNRITVESLREPEQGRIGHEVTNFEMMGSNKSSLKRRSVL